MKRSKKKALEIKSNESGIIAVCSSIRHQDSTEFVCNALMEKMKGCIIIPTHPVPSLKELDILALNFQKIIIAKLLYVINLDNDVDGDMLAEITFAKMNGIPDAYHNPIDWD